MKIDKINEDHVCLYFQLTQIKIKELKTLDSRAVKPIKFKEVNGNNVDNNKHGRLVRLVPFIAVGLLS